MKTNVSYWSPNNTIPFISLLYRSFSAGFLIDLSIIGHWFNWIFLERNYVRSLYKRWQQRGSETKGLNSKGLSNAHLKCLINRLSQCTWMFFSRSVTRAYINTLKEILEFKVILTAIRFPWYANHFKYRIPFFNHQNTLSKS